MANYLQISVLIATIAISIATFMLSRSLIFRYSKNRKARSYLFWGLGMWLFGLTTLIESLFAVNVYSVLLSDSYLFLVVVLVELLALGSIQLVKTRAYRMAYYSFAALASIMALFYIATGNPGDIIVNYVVAGRLQSNVALWSAIPTFAASVVLVGVALKSYLRKRSARMLSIIAGVVVVSIAGTLYLAAFPEFLYFAEFAGMALLWIGFR